MSQMAEMQKRSETKLRYFKLLHRTDGHAIGRGESAVKAPLEYLGSPSRDELLLGQERTDFLSNSCRLMHLNRNLYRSPAAQFPPKSFVTLSDVMLDHRKGSQ